MTSSEMIASEWAGLDTLTAMSPANAVGIADLARRWNMHRNNARKVTRNSVPKGPPFPAVTLINGDVAVYDLGEVEAWEEELRSLGLPLPGERPRGPRPRAAE